MSYYREITLLQLIEIDVWRSNHPDDSDKMITIDLRAGFKSDQPGRYRYYIARFTLSTWRCCSSPGDAFFDDSVYFESP